MTKLSVNINKIATIRNARGGNTPHVARAAVDCEQFGAQGITVHPRPDERHIRYVDVREIAPLVKTEFNIEGYPDDRFMEIIASVQPEQATLVPDPPDVLTSNAGWDTVKHEDKLKEIIKTIKGQGVRTSIFVDTNLANIEGAAKIGVDRIELYTGPYADTYSKNAEESITPYIEAANLAYELGLGVNAGHDLNLINLGLFKRSVPHLAEVSIGHALISDALYYGLENVIGMYKKLLDQ